MFCVFIVSFHQIVKAKSVVFSNWYSDEDWVGYWGSAPKVFFTNLNDSYNVSLDVNTAVNKWTSAGISSSVTVTPTNASIKYYGGTKAQLNGIGFTYTVNFSGSLIYSLQEGSVIDLTLSSDIATDVTLNNNASLIVKRVR